jgi:hypothetical protein
MIVDINENTSMTICPTIYSPKGLLVSSGGVCLGPSMNNVAEYSLVIELLHDAISHGIHSLDICLDS